MYKCGAQAISPGRETKQIQSDGRVEVKVIQARARLAIQHDLSIFKCTSESFEMSWNVQTLRYPRVPLLWPNLYNAV